VFLLAVLLTGCGQQAPAPAPVRPVASGLDATTRAFVELTIATDDQAVKLMDLGASRAVDPALRAFASGLASARRAELTELRAILSPVQYVNYHEGHDMPGMPTAAELVALASSQDFDTEFTRLARAHLTESSTVARSGINAIKHERTRTVAEAMEQERTSALRTLDALV
jgi:uncharacterized protein (DUF305 family)